MRGSTIAGLMIVLACTGCAGGPSTAATQPSGIIKVGALFPLSGPQASLASQEFAGVKLARDLVNADGGAAGRQIELVTKDLTSPSDAGARVSELKAAGVHVVLGAYSSSLSIPASQASQQAGLLYWEAGAVADQLTGQGKPLVFRVGATGGNLGAMSSHFAATVLAPRLQSPPSRLRLAIVHDVEPYPASVAVAAEQQAAREGMPVIANVSYDAHQPDWAGVLAELRPVNADVIVLSSYIEDGVGFRRAMLAGGLRTKALIGSTMAECGPEFGAMLGADAIGVFASDRPTHGFNPAALTPTGRALYARFAAAYRAEKGTEPTEESLAGFSAAWTLFHYVMPAAPEGGAAAMANAARALDLPDGTLVNGAGVRFAGTGPAMGQNTRAASVVWQWQGVRQSVTVWPPVFATGAPSFIPLPR